MWEEKGRKRERELVSPHCVAMDEKVFGGCKAEPVFHLGDGTPTLNRNTLQTRKPVSSGKASSVSLEIAMVYVTEQEASMFPLHPVLCTAGSIKLVCMHIASSGKTCHFFPDYWTGF